MKFTTTLVSLYIFSILFIQLDSLDVSADPENDDEFGSCWENDWNDIWWGIGMLGMMVMMSGGILVILIAFLYVLRNVFLQFPTIWRNGLFQGQNTVINESHQDPRTLQTELNRRPPPMYNPTSKLDERYARGEISREEYISLSLDDFINRFAEEK